MLLLLGKSRVLRLHLCRTQYGSNFSHCDVIGPTPKLPNSVKYIHSHSHLHSVLRTLTSRN